MKKENSFNPRDQELLFSGIALILCLAATVILWALCCHEGAEVHKHIIIPGSGMAGGLVGCILFAAR